MKSSKNALSFYSNKLGKDEMKNYYAGDNLPGVTVSSSYTSVYGMNYYSYTFIFPNFMSSGGSGGAGGGGNLPGQVEIPQPDSSGGGGDPNASSNFTHDFNSFLTALAHGASANGITFDSIKTFLSNTDNLHLVRRLGIATGIVGSGISIVQFIDHAIAGQLSEADWISLSFAVLGLVALSSFFAPGFGLTIGIAGLGWSIFNPN